MNKSHYHYEECGLDNVLLVGLPGCTDDAGEGVVTIPHIDDLHRLLAHAVATKPAQISPKELRFLRTELGLTQTQLADVVGKDGQTVGRWERAETVPIEPAAETLIRLLTLQHLNGSAGPSPSVETLARRSMEALGSAPFCIDAHDPSRYAMMPQAA